MIEYTEQAHMADSLRMCGEGTFANCARCGADNIFCHGIMRQRMLAAADMIEAQYRQTEELRQEIAEKDKEIEDLKREIMIYPDEEVEREERCGL